MTAPVITLTCANGAGSLIETKGISVSDNPTPPPAGDAPFAPVPPAAPSAPQATPALPAYPTAPYPPQPPQASQPPQLGQTYPGAPPAYAASAPQAWPVQPDPWTATPYGAYGAPAYPVAPPRPTSGLAITSLVCGIGGVVLIWAIIPILASIAAVITGHMALRQTKDDPSIAGRGMAIAGLILGYAMIAVGAFTLVSIIISFLFVGAFSLPFLFSR